MSTHHLLEVGLKDADQDEECQKDSDCKKSSIFNDDTHFHSILLAALLWAGIGGTYAVSR